MLLELCVTELEDVATDSQSGRLSSQPVVVESSHPYTDDTSSSGTVKIPGIVGGGEAGAAGLASAASAASAAAGTILQSRVHGRFRHTSPHFS